jgi:predicted  nucleic acid-binding Zn-ribbon protein
MTTPNPAEELASQIQSLQAQMSDLEKNAWLTNIRDNIGELQTTIQSFAQKISELRSRGYVFGKDFETRAANFINQWTQVSPNVTAQIEQQSSQLQSSLAPLRNQTSQLVSISGNVAQAQSLFRQIKPQVDSLESQISAAESQIRGTIDSLQSQAGEFKSQLAEIDWTLTQIAEASFQLLATEAAVMAVKAVWVKGGKEQKDDPDGVLYLTDQRLIFEEKEEVAKEKVLFIATKKEKVQKLLLESPVALAESVTISKQGIFKNEDHIEIKFASGAPVITAHFHIWQAAEKWQALINRAKTKDFENDRAVALDANAAAKVKSAPAQCPNCGGNINQVILRGQDNIKCEFCGFIIRL